MAGPAPATCLCGSGRFDPTKPAPHYADGRLKAAHDETHHGAINRYTFAAVPLYSAFFSLAVAPAVMRLNAFHNSV